MEMIEAIEKLKDNHALICLENRALIKMEKEKFIYGIVNGIQNFQEMILFHYFNRIRLKFMKMTMVLIWKKMKSIMHGVIAIYERIYFMIGIVYSSKTGNTQSLANSLNFMESKYCVPVENAKI